MNIAADQRRERFARWIRTGNRVDDELELKFNPWHDPDDGRFTFAGAGRHFARGSTEASSERVSPPSSITYGDDPAKPPITTLEEAEAWAVSERAKRGTTPGYAEAIDARLKLYRDSIAPRSHPPTKERSEEVGGAAGFADGLGEGVYDVGRGLAVGMYTLATSPPRQTIENNALGIARAVDAVLAAEDTSGHVLIGRGANAITNASAHDWGYAVGTIAANVGLGVGSRALV